MTVRTIAVAALVFAFFATLSACDSATPRDRCPAPWLPDACPDSLRVPW